MLLDYSPDDIDVRIADLLVATADASDDALDARVQEVLRLLRDRLAMDVVFVSRFENGRRTFTHVEQAANATPIAPGQSDPLEESWCQRVVDGRLPELVADARPYVERRAVPPAPFPIGSHLSTPVPAGDGQPLGTLCCFSFTPREGVGTADIKRLKYAAELLSAKLAPKRRLTADDMELQPIERADAPRRA
ncbi:GAF domain-containing protein [Ramlibacter pallidus]|uniref:Histidine kinase n=1 Tax=Ramlibacter pallidus TaxID=2780087 RepID=A0ABR9S4N8_9BURK|nr:GAF domain-containing protein [Ramlibacter pallidus]MBE7368399.1 histidine kinase [Ramlibacter pallidus]